MRQVFASVPRGKGAEGGAISAAHHGTNLAWFPAMGQDGSCDMVVIHVPNDGLNPLLAELQQSDNLHVSFFPLQRWSGIQLSDPEIQETLATAIQEQLRKTEPHATPLVSITILN